MSLTINPAVEQAFLDAREPQPTDAATSANQLKQLKGELAVEKLLSPTPARRQNISALETQIAQLERVQALFEKSFNL